jgi:sugar O-acyltransferase (sialic acid O-acetyltransferase NeuD family)
MRDLVIVGAGGHGRETLDIVEALNAEAPTWQFVGFVDDGSPDLDRLRRRGATLLGPVDVLADLDADHALAVGGGPTRVAALDRLRRLRPGREAVTLVHPRATLGGDNRIGPGSLVAAGCHVTTNVRIGAYTHLNVGTSVHHDSVVGDLVTLSPGVLVNGDVVVGDEAWLGPGAIIGRGVSVGPGAVVGAGAVVLADVGPGERVGGVPARPLVSEGVGGSGDDG